MKNYLIYFFSMLPFAITIGQLPVSHFSGLIGYLLGIAAVGAAQFIKQEIEWRAAEKIMNNILRENFKSMIFYEKRIKK